MKRLNKGLPFRQLAHLTDDQPTDDGLPSWTLIEKDPAGAPTCRNVDALHEDLLTLDPSGREGWDLWN